MLNGTNLHVDGDFTVNGSITGEGAIYVNGNTELKGTAQVSTARPDKTALYSQGSISLTGYDGTAYMDSLTADSTLATAWANTKTYMGEFQVALNSPHPRLEADVDHDAGSGHPSGDDSQSHREFWTHGPGSDLFYGRTPGGRRRDRLQLLRLAR